MNVYQFEGVSRSSLSRFTENAWCGGDMPYMETKTDQANSRVRIRDQGNSRVPRLVPELQGGRKQFVFGNLFTILLKRLRFQLPGREVGTYSFLC